MAETLLAILLVTSSAKGSSLVYRWPCAPASPARLARPRPDHRIGAVQLDNPGRAASYSDGPAEHKGDVITPVEYTLDRDGDYEWKRPSAVRDRSMSISRSVHRSSSGRNSPSENASYDLDNMEELSPNDDGDDLFGYSSEFLAGLLCPRRSLCHQKFELIVDELAFIGHPVCAEEDGTWRFKPEKFKSGSRGRGSRNRQLSQLDEKHPDTSISPEVERNSSRAGSWLQRFHLVFALDLPDPSSSASGNVSKYFDIIYEQIAFTVTAVLFQEQVLSNFVEAECEKLGALKDEYISKGEPFADYMSHALRVSSLAPAIKALYEAIKASTMGHITIHNLPIELQLPPHLDRLLHSEDDFDLDFVDYEDDGGEANAWGQEMAFGWRLPVLAPWKSLLLLDGPDGQSLDLQMSLDEARVGSNDRALAEGLIRFLETVSVTLSLNDMASLLDWDLESQIYPIVRWLVHHRRAKIVDTVHHSLKTVFTLPHKFETPLSDLIVGFKTQFPQPSVMPLPKILSAISTSTSKQSDNHFFATVVMSKDLINLYHDVVLWMLKRDLLITLHLRVRIVASGDLKMRVRMARDMKWATNGRTGSSNGRASIEVESDSYGQDLDADGTLEPMGGINWLSLSPKSARRHTRRLPSVESRNSKSHKLLLDDDGDEDENEFDDSDEADVGWGSKEDTLWPSMINDPGRASPLQRKWLSAMSEGKEEYIANRFNQINQYFDGKNTDDEILYRAEISRKQLREVLHHYEEHLQTFLHPS